MIPGDLSACPHRQFHTLPCLLHSWAALLNSYPKACVPVQGGSLYHFYGLWDDLAGTRTHNLPCERRTCLPQSQPDTVFKSDIKPPKQTNIKSRKCEEHHRHFYCDNVYFLR